MKKIAGSPLVSVIIPTRNSAANISNCLKSIRRQAYKNIEIIVIDNYSSDNTVKLSQKYADIVETKGPERNVQRNFGIHKSSGKFISWFDSDMVLEPNVIKECVAQINDHPEAKALIIPERSVGEGFWAKCKSLEKRCYLGDSNIEAIRFIDRQSFREIGELSQNFISGEDWDITIRLRNKGYAIGRIQSFVIHHEGKLSLIQDLKKKYYYATKSLPYINRHIRGPRDILLFIFRPAFINNWKILISDPLHALGLMIIKFSEYGVGLLGILQAKYKGR